MNFNNVNEKCYLIGHQANTNDFITEFDFQRGVYFIPNKVGSNKKADYNWIISIKLIKVKKKKLNLKHNIL